MRTSRQRAAGSGRALSANDRLKARWGSRMAWSTSVAVVVHALLFIFSPRWVTTSPKSESVIAEGNRLLALATFEEAAGLPVAPPAPVPARGESQAEGPDAGLDDHDEVVELDGGDLWNALGERLRRRGDLLPRLAQPETDLEVDVVEAEGAAEDAEEGEPTIGGQAATTDLSDLPEPGSLDLDRLSAIRPKLAVMTPSAWVLIRNPLEVEAFLRRGYLQGTLDPDASGSVSVTLWINRRGTVEWAEVSKSSGRRDLDEYALALFNEVVTFKAAREEGVSVSRSVTLSVNFPW